MARVIPFVLRTLRSRRGLTQEQLAQRAKIDKQTVYRLEADQSEHDTTRQHTVEGLAQALRTDPDILTGQRPLPDARDDEAPALELSKLNLGVSTQARNAMYLVSERYSVTYSDIIELAPFLFCWAAEASLHERKQRLAQAQSALKELQQAESSIGHLEPCDYGELEKKIDAEKQSIECHDIWGKATELAIDGEYPFDNPFSQFLESLVEEMGEDASFREYCWGDYPFYRVCGQEAVDLVGGDTKLAEEVLDGHIALHQMPKELREFGKNKDRAEWARAKLEEFQQYLRRCTTDK